MDELGIFFKESFEAESRLIEQARGTGVEHEIRASNEFAEPVAARFGIEIELYGPLIPVIGREAEAAIAFVAIVLIEEGAYAPGVAAPNWFDADHVSTEIPEHHPGQLTTNVGEVEHSIGGK